MLDPRSVYFVITYSAIFTFPFTFPDIGVSFFPQFFQAMMQAGVESMYFSLDDVTERSSPQGHAVVECTTASWTHQYTNGYKVVLRGSLTCHVVLSNTPAECSGLQQAKHWTKIENLQFRADFRNICMATDRGLQKESPGASFPTIPVFAPDEGWFENQGVVWVPCEEHIESLHCFGFPMATSRIIEVRLCCLCERPREELMAYCLSLQYQCNQ
jgi:LIM-domain binding protein